MSPEATIGTIARTVGGEVVGDGGTTITDVVHDSRDATTGALFCAVRGFTADGHAYVGAAQSLGASGALVEDSVDVDISQIVVDDVRRRMADAAAVVHGHPSREMTVVGITGTNGKTTATYMLEAIAGAAGVSFGRIGTLGASVDGVDVKVARTTPESTDLQRLLRTMADSGVRLVAMEVSSHALVLHRADAVDFAVAAFTNLSQDHLDFHADMDEYFAAKRQLFDGRAHRHVVGTFDRAGRVLADSLGDEAVLVGFDDDAVVTATDLDVGLARSTFTLVIGDEQVSTSVRPGGRFNVANALIAAACAHEAGIDAQDIARGLADTARVPGRLDPVEAGQPFDVVVDYAHSPGGVETVVQMANDVVAGRVIAVVGSAGDRDADKRPMMGAAAALADVAVITSDNPRTEDPQLLVDAVVAGTAGSDAEVVVEVDRTSAIHRALDMAAAGDAVLILGKGHEQGQDFGDRVVPFDDHDVALRHLEARWADA